MRKWKNCLAFLLAIVLMSSGVWFMCTQAVADSGTNKTAENMWDFNESSQLTSDFSLYKRNADGTHFSVRDGRLYATPSTASDCRKAVLNAEYDINTASVDIYPADGTYYGGIMLGITGKVGGGTTSNPSIMILVEDSDKNNSRYTVRVYGYTGNKEYKILDVSGSSLLYSDKEAQAVNMRVEISGSNLKITLKTLSDKTTVVNAGIYQCETDIAEYKDGNGKTVFSAENLKGKAGLFGRNTATFFDDFVITAPVSPVTGKIYRFTDSDVLGNDFSLYKRNADGTHFVVRNDLLYAAPSTASDCRKAILNTIYDVEQVSADLYPADGVLYGGIMLGINKNDNLTYGGGVLANPSVMVTVQDSKTEENALTLRVNVYGDNNGDGKTDDVLIFQKNYGNSGKNALYTSGQAQAVRMTVRVEGTSLLIRLSLLANDNIYVEETADITFDSKGVSTAFDSTTLKGKIGLAAREYATGFDNFAVKGSVSANADSAEEIEVDGITSTYTFEDAGELLDFDFYRSVTAGGFALNHGMLTVSTSSKEGEYKAILRGEGRTYQKVSVDIYPGTDGIIHSGIYLGVSNAESTWGSVDGVNILLQSDSNDPDKANQMSIYVGDYPNWKVFKKVNETIFHNGVREPVRLTVYIVGRQLTVSVSLLSNPGQYIQFQYLYEGKYDLTQGKVGIRSRNANNGFDNFTVTYQQSDLVIVDANVKTDIPAAVSPATGDRAAVRFFVTVMFISLSAIIMAWNKKRRRLSNGGLRK